LRIGHPYVGDKVADGSPEIENDAYKGLYPYVDDEENKFNSSSKMLPGEAVFNTNLKMLFKKTFVDGKLNRMSRTTAFEFAAACLEASNLLMKCSNCSSWYLPVSKSGNAFLCSWCGTANDKPNLINFYDSCKIYDNGLSGKQSELKKQYLLRKSNNSITDNYIFRSNTEIDFKEYFKIAYGKNEKKYILNPEGKEIFFKKYNSKEKPFKISAVDKIEIDKGDIIYFQNPSEFEKDNKNDHGITRMKILRYAQMS